MPTRPDLRAVHQTKYQPGSAQTRWNVLSPVDFIVGGKEGIRLIDAMNLNFSHLDARDDHMFVEECIGSSVSLRIGVRIPSEFARTVAEPSLGLVCGTPIG